MDVLEGLENSNWASVHFVSVEQTRSEVAEAANDSYCDWRSQTIRAVQFRSEINVGGVDWKVTPCSQIERVLHVRSTSDVGGELSYSPTLQVVRVGEEVGVGAEEVGVAVGAEVGVRLGE